MDPVQNNSVDAFTNVKFFCIFRLFILLFCVGNVSGFSGIFVYICTGHFTQCNTPLPSIIKYCQVKARLLQQLRRSLV